MTSLCLIQPLALGLIQRVIVRGGCIFNLKFCLYSDSPVNALLNNLLKKRIFPRRNRCGPKIET